MALERRGVPPGDPASGVLDKVDVELLGVLRHPEVVAREPAVRTLWMFQRVLRVAAGVDRGHKNRARLLVRGLAEVFVRTSFDGRHKKRRAPSARERDLKETFGRLTPMVKKVWPAVATFFSTLAIMGAPGGGDDDSDDAWRTRFSPAMLARPGTPEAENLLDNGGRTDRHICARWLETYLTLMLLKPGTLSAPFVQRWATRVFGKRRVAPGTKRKEAVERTLTRIWMKPLPGGCSPLARTREEAAYHARKYAATVFLRDWTEEQFVETELKSWDKHSTMTRRGNHAAETSHTERRRDENDSLSDDRDAGDASESEDESGEESEMGAGDLPATKQYSLRSLRRLTKKKGLEKYPTTFEETAELRRDGMLLMTHRKPGTRTLPEMEKEFDISRGKLRVAENRAVNAGKLTKRIDRATRNYAPKEQRIILEFFLKAVAPGNRARSRMTSE